MLWCRLDQSDGKFSTNIKSWKNISLNSHNEDINGNLIDIKPACMKFPLKISMKVKMYRITDKNENTLANRKIGILSIWEECTCI